MEGTLNTSWIEIVWFISAVIATGFCAWGLRDTIIDTAFLISAGINGPRKIIAENNQRGEAFRMIKACVMLLASGASLVLPPPPPSYSELPQSLVGLMAWLIVAGALIMHSLSDRVARRRLARYSAQERPLDPMSGHTVLEKGADAGQATGILSTTYDQKDRRRTDEHPDKTRYGDTGE